MKGHQDVSTSLRPEEVALVGHLVTDLERASSARQMTSSFAPYVPPIRRSTVIRQAVRYVLEHRAEFEAWFADECNRRGGLR